MTSTRNEAPNGYLFLHVAEKIDIIFLNYNFIRTCRMLFTLFPYFHGHFYNYQKYFWFKHSLLQFINIELSKGNIALLPKYF